MSELTQILEAITKLSGRLDVLEGRVGPTLADLPPDPVIVAPEGVQFNPSDGYYYRELDQKPLRVCEDCWQVIPRYRDFPQGLISPESDGDAHGNGAKTRRSVVEGKPAVAHLPKAICLPCYVAAFTRVYPTAVCMPLSAELVPTGEAYPALPVTKGTGTLSQPGQAPVLVYDEVAA